MDPNEFSFEALFRSGDFKIYESEEQKSACAELNRVLELYTKDIETMRQIENAAWGYASASRYAAFTQGFCFAVKSIKFLLKI